jgi:sulfopyruvate decarboxylase subunit alpha
LGEGHIGHPRHDEQEACAPGGDLRGSSIIREIPASSIEFVVSVPEITTSEGLLRPLAREKSPRLIRVCKEDEGIGICAGLAHCNKRVLLLIQQTGMLDSISAMRGEWLQPSALRKSTILDAGL